MWKSVSAFVFNEWFWLPPNVTWESFAITPSTLVNGEPTYYPRVPDLLWAFPIALFIIPLRFFVERYIFCTVLPIYASICTLHFSPFYTVYSHDNESVPQRSKMKMIVIV